MMTPRRSGKTAAMALARYLWTRENPTGVVVEVGPAGVRIEKPITAADLVPEPAPAALYGFYRNGCIHESAAALVSLHASKAGAWKAKHAAMFAATVEEREFGLHCGGRSWLRRKPLRDQSYFIAPIEVLP